MGKTRRKCVPALVRDPEADRLAFENGARWVEYFGAWARTHSGFPVMGRPGCHKCHGAGVLIAVPPGLERKVSSMGYPVKFPAMTENFVVVSTKYKDPNGPSLAATPCFCMEDVPASKVLLSEFPPGVFVDEEQSNG